MQAKKFSNRLSDEGPMIESRSKMLEIIDTTLLKCYLQTNSRGLVASLLRLKVSKSCYFYHWVFKRFSKSNESFLMSWIIQYQSIFEGKSLPLGRNRKNSEKAPKV